jgi:glucan phosphoethanolaminetransferase (alkaline phosphatase superfamily)
MSESNLENENKVLEKKKIPFITNIMNIGKNWRTVQNNPYASQKLMVGAYKWIMILIGIIIIFQFVKIIISFSAGSNAMAMLGRAFVLLVMVIFISNLWKMYNNMKKTIQHYEIDPVNSLSNANYANEKKLDIKKEVDDILNKFEPKKEEKPLEKKKALPKKALITTIPDVKVKSDIKMPSINTKKTGNLISNGLFDSNKYKNGKT